MIRSIELRDRQRVLQLLYHEVILPLQYGVLQLKDGLFVLLASAERGRVDVASNRMHDRSDPRNGRGECFGG
jgi:hypothetical protein